MKISHIEHLGIAVESIEAALPYYENVLGLKCYNIEEVADQKVKTDNVVTKQKFTNRSQQRRGNQRRGKRAPGWVSW